MGQRTPLYDLHLALGAKMVDFGGWDMPSACMAAAVRCTAPCSTKRAAWWTT
jgi:glycine cleavage system aminomethyltransferase T